MEGIVTGTEQPARHVEDVIQLGLRLWIALVFWQSGVSKIDGSWQSVLFLFKHEHPVPFLPAEYAAPIAVAFEIAMPVLLVIGLGARFATLPLMAITAVIQFTYLQSHDHVLWALALLTIFIRGSGRYSWDFFIRRAKMGNATEAGDLTVALSGVVVTVLTIFAGHELLYLAGITDEWLPEALDWWKAFGKE